MIAPIVSVIMPTYNGADLIGETIASLQAQTLGDFELIIVDDCSTDATVSVARSVADPRIRVIAAPVNRRVVLTRNAAFAEARGRYIAALDHDDLSHPTRLARQVAYLEAHPEIVLVGSAANILCDGAILPPALAPLSTPALIAWLMRIENPLVWSSVMMRADAARKLDPFQRPDRVYAEDFDLYHRISAYGGVARIDDALLTYRRHGGGASQLQATAMRERATEVLADAYVPVFGDAAAETAALIGRYVMAHEPVPDRATFKRVGETLVRLQDAFLTQHKPDAESLALIRWETARRWGRIGRAGLRTGGLTLGDATGVRPDHLGMGYAGIEELILSRLVGTIRSVQRRERKRG
ncbi:glycosyltransferase family 2 protein [Sphingomonas sp. PAMC 26605]|uniref:glycosyltransferase family 2 protein n=1 Tax=Sphingomonas sp. PAMC 26605 TaxID=1112214 RepID=UPI00026CA60B|nr:glycosyltransferase family A protein [Sphingomonas sp. PAMC 26605]